MYGETGLWVVVRPLVSDYAANPASSSGAWKSREKSCFPGGNLGHDLTSYVNPLFFNALRGDWGLRLSCGRELFAPPFRKDKPVSLGAFSGVTGFLFPLVSKGFAPVSHLSKSPLRTIDSPHLPAFLSLFGL